MAPDRQPQQPGTARPWSEVVARGRLRVAESLALLHASRASLAQHQADLDYTRAVIEASLVVLRRRER